MSFLQVITGMWDTLTSNPSGMFAFIAMLAVLLGYGIWQILCATIWAGPKTTAL